MLGNRDRVLALGRTLGLLWGIAQAVPAQAQSPDSGRLIGEVIERCPRQSNPLAWRELEADVLLGIRRVLRRGDVQEALSTAEALDACRRRQTRTRDFDPEVRSPFLQEVMCAVPILLFEQQRHVDEEVARRALRECPAPSTEPPEGDEASIRRWGERVHRHLLLQAMVREPEAVLPETIQWMESLRKVGLWKGIEVKPPAEAPAGQAVSDDGPMQEELPEGTWGMGEPQCGNEEEEVGEGEGEDGAPEAGGPETEEGDGGLSSFQNPLLTAQVLAVVSSFASGNRDVLVRALGGEEGICRSPLLQSMGLVTMLPRMPSALRMAQERLLAPRVAGPVARLVEELATLGSETECPGLGMLSVLALGSLSAEQVRSLIARGQGPALAGLWRHVPPILEVPGEAQERLALLELLATGPSFPEQKARRCEWVRRLLEAGNAGRALEALKGPAAEADCRETLRIWAHVADEAARGQEGVDGERVIDAWLGRPLDPQDVLEFLQQVSPEEVQRAVVARIGRAAIRAKGPLPGRKAVLRALVKTIDNHPGTPLGDAAWRVIRQAKGWAESPAEEAIGRLVAARHLLLSGRKGEASRVWRDALSRVRPGMEEVETALWLVVLAALREGQDDWVRQGKTTLVSLPPREPILVTEVAVHLSRRGMRDLAIQVMKGTTEWAVKAGLDSESLAMLAETWLLLDQPQEARRLQSSPTDEGGEKATGNSLLTARLAMTEKDYPTATRILDELVTKDPENTDFRYQRALAQMLRGHPEAAEQDLRVCLQSGPRNPMVLGALGYALFDQGRFPDAESWFRQALDLDPEEPDNLLGLALTLFRMGREEEAREIWREHLRSHPLFRSGIEAAEQAGYSYSERQKNAWKEFRKTLPGPGRGPEPRR